MGRPGTKKGKFFQPGVKEVARRLREGATYQLLAGCPHEGARKLAAALLVGRIEDELKRKRKRAA